MSPHRITRLISAFAAAGLALTLAPAAYAHHANPPGPVNAQSTFKWGRPYWQDDFESGLKSFWRIEGPGVVRNQHGMLTLNTDTTGTVSATLTRAGHATGRWEIRLRSRRYETAYSNYRVRTELIPAADADEHCGARNIGLENYRFGAARAQLYIRNLPDLAFRSSKRLNLGNDQWHTFAVEVTPRHIAWLVDAHVINTERRSAALSGVPFTVRFTMVGQTDARMNRSRMQMDWLRYFTLDRPNAKSIDAPQTNQTTYADAC